MRTVVHDVPPQDVITRDNVSIKVNAVVYFRVIEPMKAIIDVENFLYATSQLSQTTLRSVLGQAELDELLSHREKINERLQEILDKHTEPWGIKVSNVEVKNVDLPQEMQRAIARQAEAERERRAKVISAEGEFQASTKLHEAADILSQNPMALQLRYLTTLVEIATEKNSTIIFPLPIDLLKVFTDKMLREVRVRGYEKTSCQASCHSICDLLFFCCAGGAFAKAGPVKKGRHGQSASASGPRAEKVAEEPAKAYVVMEAWTGKVLEEQNMHEKRAPASMAKLMTACIVLDKIAKGEVHLTDKVPVSREAAAIGGSQVYLKEGEVFTLEDMMRAMLIASANDAAHAVAELIAGTSGDFVDADEREGEIPGYERYGIQFSPRPAAGERSEGRPYVLL